MRLLYLSSLGGGLDTSVRVLGQALVNAGHQVSVLYVHLPGQPVPLVDNFGGCRVYDATVGNWHYWAQRATFGMTSIPRLIREFEHAFALAALLSRIQSETKFDLIEIPEVFATPWLTKNLPYIVRLHSAAWTWRRMEGGTSSSTDSLEVRIEKYTLHRAAAISSPSIMLANYIREMCDLGPRHIEIIPYPIDTQRFIPDADCSRLPLVLFVGRVERRKGAHVLVEAIPHVWDKRPECIFVFAGRVCEDIDTNALAKHPQIKFLGVCSHDVLIGWYQRASIFAAPSLWDNSPNTIYEAMACGTPVVASRVGGIPELVDDGATGLLVPPSDPCALAEAIIALLDDAVQRERMGQHAREKVVDCYSVEKVIEKTLHFYQCALSI